MPRNKNQMTPVGLEEEAKLAYYTKKYEIQGIERADAIREQHIAEQAHDDYHDDLEKSDDDEHADRIDEKNFDEVCFQLRGLYPDKEFDSTLNWKL